MMNPITLSLVAAYLGAGIFYASSDLVSAGLPLQIASPYNLAALSLVAICWAPSCLLATVGYARLVGWRPAFLYFKADVAPALAIFAGGVALAASS